MPKKQVLDLFHLYANMVYRLSFSYLRSSHDAEDAVQTIFLKLIEGKAQPESGKERAFLIQVTVNYCKDILRSAWRKKTIPMDVSILLKKPVKSRVFTS